MSRDPDAVTAPREHARVEKSGAMAAVPPLLWSGERFIPGEGGPEIYYEHAHRYVLARGLLAGAAVVDLASGEGYGAAWLAEVAASVVGIDIDEGSVRHSRAQYARHDNLSFAVGDIQSLPLADDCVDAVTCFEAIEHVHNPRAVVEEVVRILRPGGLLLISTPNKAEYADQRDYDNEFHIHEFYLPDLELLLSEYFADRELVGQRVVAGSVTWRLGTSAAGGNSDDHLDVLVAPGFHESGTSEPPSMVEPMYVLAACRLGDTPRISGSLPSGTVLVDSEELLLKLSLQREQQTEELNDHLRDQEAQLERARAQLAAYEEQATLLRRRIGELEEQRTRSPSARGTHSDAAASLQAALFAHQELAALLTKDLQAATELNVRLLAELRDHQSSVSRVQLVVPVSAVPPSTRIRLPLLGLAPQLSSFPRRFRSAVRRIGKLVS